VDGTVTVIGEPVQTARTSLGPAPPDPGPAPAPAGNESLEYRDRIGEGGMATVHRVHDRHLLRDVALKVMLPKLAANHQAVRRFVAEAQIQAQLDHPNIVPVHELVPTSEQSPYFTMRLVRGRTLGACIKESGAGLSSPAVLESLLGSFLKVCDAVAFAHSRGVVHCDLKPENILIGSFGSVYLMDWGVARLLPGTPGEAAVVVSTDGGAAPAPERVIGTPAYMAPEQARGDTQLVDERTDVFGLGAVLHAIVTGRPPHTESKKSEALEAARAGIIELPLRGPEGSPVPPRLAATVTKALSRERHGRHANVLELRAEVERFMRGGHALPTRSYRAGESIVREGESGEEAFVLESGTCVAYKSSATERRILREMGPGAVFGETAILSPGPRTATVEAVSDVVLRVVTRDDLEQGLGLDSWLGAFVVALADRFRELDAELMRRPREPAGE
jgi:serine/threonine protein kinase